MILTQREQKVRRIRGMRSLALNVAFAWIVVSAVGLYAGFALHRYLLAFTFIAAGNCLFVWCLSLYRRAQRLLKLCD